MKQRLKANMTITEIEAAIIEEIASCELWGDLEITFDEYEIVRKAILNVLIKTHRSIEDICRNYPNSITTFLVFFARFKYDTNFWGAVSNEINYELEMSEHDILGNCTRKQFSKYKMDYSDTKDEVWVNIAPILYEAGIPPESSLDDVFYILSYDSYGVFDPQVIIDDLIDMRSYAIRKPLLRFLKRFKNDRAIDYLLEVYDAIISSEQNNSVHSRYMESYAEWKEQEKTKAVINRRKDKEFQSRPFLYFDEGRNGLSIMLPRIIIENEWIDTAKWTITSKTGFKRTLVCRVFGDEGKRFTNNLSVSVMPDEVYTVKLQDTEILNDNPKNQWEILGIPSDKPVWFNSNGRLINTNYILSPYGILVRHSKVSVIDSQEVSIEEQYYPNNSKNYEISSVTPLGSNAKITFDIAGKRIELASKPQYNLELQGETLFGVQDSNLFTEIPQLVVRVEGDANCDYLELRMGDISYPFSIIGDSLTFNLKKTFGKDINGFGTFNIRLYQNGRFLKQVEYYHVPTIKSNYSTQLLWPSNRKKLNDIKTYKFKRLKDWDLEFHGCNVFSDEEYYIVEVPSSVGAISVNLRSLIDNLFFSCSFELPVNPYEYDILTSHGEMIENSTKLYKTNISDLIDNDFWFSLRVYGSFNESRFKIAIKSLNGIDQIETIKLNYKSAGNIDLGAFYDTIRNSPLPLELILICDDNLEEAIPIIYVSEVTTFANKIKITSSTNNDYVVLGKDDDGKDIDITRFGFNSQKVHLKYDCSKLSKNGTSRGYPFPTRFTEGIYLVSGEEKESIFETDDNDISFVDSNNVLYVRCPKEDNRIVNSKHLIDSLFNIVLFEKTGNAIMATNSFIYLTDQKRLERLEIIKLDDSDIERLVAMAYIANEKNEKYKNSAIESIMRCISASLLKRGDRYRIIELLVELNAPQKVFDTCLRNYSLLLTYSDNPERKVLAGKVERFSPELSMILMMSTDGKIRDCMWKDKYIEIIGRDSIKHLLSVPDAHNKDDIKTEIKRFVNEIPGNGVVINFDDQIAGNIEAIQGMIVFDKWGNPKFDMSKKPDYGIYFNRIKYVDQYVNWYKNTHDMNGEMKSGIRALKNYVITEYGNKIIDCIKELNIHKEWKRFAKQYIDTIEERTEMGASTSSYGWYFYLQGLAAFLARLPIEREYDSKRKVGIKFMSFASVIAPKLSQRDILMAEVYIYLKRKEESLCQ